MARQNDIETIKDLLHRGELTADQANVQMVRNDRFRMVINSLPASVRKALNAAVKTGALRKRGIEEVNTPWRARREIKRGKQQ
ncbi:hypothetical protein QYP02_36455 [Pseudomonas aeruginosa]|nr:hypothetical protein [Pseudomonas aeruginosa]